MGAIDLVIFDCDGVLVDSEAVSNAVLADALTAAGAPITAGGAHSRFRGKLLEDVAQDIKATNGIDLPDGFWESFERDRALAFEQSLLPIEGAAKTVGAVKAAGYSVCVASQGKRSKTEMTLSLTGLRAMFGETEIFSAYDVPRGKPQPDLFLHAAETLQTPATACAVVEDTAIGIRAALAAGMTAIGLADGADAQHIRKLGATTIERLPELLEVLARL